MGIFSQIKNSGCLAACPWTGHSQQWWPPHINSNLHSYLANCIQAHAIGELGLIPHRALSLPPLSLSPPLPPSPCVQVTLLFPLFQEHDSPQRVQDGEAVPQLILRDVNDYNRRFSGQPRSVSTSTASMRPTGGSGCVGGDIWSDIWGDISSRITISIIMSIGCPACCLNTE